MSGRNVLIYGLGRAYHDNKDFIRDRYANDTLYYCDRDSQKLEDLNNGISLSEWFKQPERFDVVLVTPIKADIPAIILEMIINGVPENCFEILRYLLYFETNPYRTLQFGIRFMGQFSDDAIILYMIMKIGVPINQVKYLEIGTNDPIVQNNTVVLYQMGARGMLIDPLPSSRCLAEKYRVEDRFIQGVVCADYGEDEIEFYVGAGSQISSVKKELTGNVVHTIRSKVYRINDLLSMFTETPTLLTIDAEGQDEAIIRDIDFDKYRPSIIEFEADKTDPHGIDSYLTDSGYNVMVKMGGNLVYIRGDKLRCFPEWTCV